VWCSRKKGCHTTRALAKSFSPIQTTKVALQHTSIRIVASGVQRVLWQKYNI
jgi:hypothetical protein